MPNTKAAKKSLKQDAKKNAKNSLEKRAIKEQLKRINKALETGQADKVKEMSVKFQKMVDKAVKAGWLKKNTAGRKKSRLAKKVKKTSKK